MKLSAEAAHLPHLRPLPESQPSSSPLLQTAPGIKGHQRVVTLAQHISVSVYFWAPTIGVDRRVTSHSQTDASMHWPLHSVLWRLSP